MSARLSVDPARICLDLPAGSRGEAVRSTVDLLRADPRILSWDGFTAAVAERPLVDLGDKGICLAHGRGEAVKDLVLAASRPQSSAGDVALPSLVFVFGIPAAMAEEYLRAVGALARVCADGVRVAALLSVPTAEEFAAQLRKWIA
jgi:mannitol/fructose-specific phosphotransferase system IIA component (Ntr-type)